MKSLVVTARRFCGTGTNTVPMSLRSKRYWIAVASRDHVQNGVKLGVAQACHGKINPMTRMSPGDWLIYYSSKVEMGGKVPCKRFTAIGEVKPKEAYPFTVDIGESKPMCGWRRDVDFKEIAKEVDIVPLIPQLAFIKNKERWGFMFRTGFFEIPKEDFELIRERLMGG